MTSNHKYWLDTIKFAKECSWQAGPFPAKKMQRNDFQNWERVLVIFVDNKMAGFCVITEKDDLPDKYEFSRFIGFVFVKEEFRGNRLLEKLINHAIKYLKRTGYKEVYLTSGEKGLYEKYGFRKVGDYQNIFKTIDQLFIKTISK